MLSLTSSMLLLAGLSGMVLGAGRGAPDKRPNEYASETPAAAQENDTHANAVLRRVDEGVAEDQGEVAGGLCCGFNPGDRVHDVKNNCGTVVCCDFSDPDLPVLVSWDDQPGGGCEHCGFCDNGNCCQAPGTYNWPFCWQIQPGCGGNPVCGDGVCECDRGETVSNCPGDCVDTPCADQPPVNVCQPDTYEMCVNTVTSCPCDPAPPQCDFCNAGNCDPSWYGDGFCDCACQFCDIDCPEWPNCCISGPAPAFVNCDVFPSGCGSCTEGMSQPVGGDYLFCSTYTPGTCDGDTCARLWIDWPQGCDPEAWWRFECTQCSDSFEPDDSSFQATTLQPGTPQTHSICPIGDADWYQFTLQAESGVTIETSGPNGNTRMWLYDSNLGQIGFDSNGGIGLFSKIDRVCGVDPLGPGNYFVKVDEFGNNGEIPDYDITLTVAPCPCPGDSSEPDDSSFQATTMQPGTPQTHSICPTGDVDWYEFTLQEGSGVTIETSGPSGDTNMWLYGSNLGQIEYDNNDGIGLFSKIDRVCGVDPLGPGSYFVKVGELGNNGEIPEYDITLTVAPCACPDTQVALVQPQDRFRDARQPHPLNDATTPSGMAQIRAAAPAASADVACWTLCESNQNPGLHVAPGPNWIDSTGYDPGSGVVTLNLHHPLTPGEVTKIVYVSASGAPLQVGTFMAHPGDVNDDGTSAPADILGLIDCLNGVAACEIWQCDIDRSDACGPEDILRVIDLLNGAAAFQPWLDVSVVDDLICPPN